jgi:hypothetical protein
MGAEPVRLSDSLECASHFSFGKQSTPGWLHRVAARK